MIERNPPTVVAPFVLLVPTFSFVCPALLFSKAFMLVNVLASLVVFSGLC